MQQSPSTVKPVETAEVNEVNEPKVGSAEPKVTLPKPKAKRGRKPKAKPVFSYILESKEISINFS